jgi:hypothetical protein
LPQKIQMTLNNRHLSLSECRLVQWLSIMNYPVIKL